MTEQIVDNRYRIINRIGSGGMGDVFCAEDLQLGRKVALKILHRRFAEDAEFVERFRREASSAAGLQHQNVVSVYDRGEYDGTYYIAMEHLEGRNLKAIVNQAAPLEPALAIDLVLQILGAARFAHKRGIIHRDLKPHNVIVDGSDPSRPTLKVTDFGIAKAGASDMTQTGSIMGTAQYLSPEQAQGHAVSATSDLYSVGIILFELLTGRIPFDGESAVTIALKQVGEAPPSPSQLNPAVTPQLEAVVLRAMAKDPAARFRDADEFIAALEAIRAGLPAPAPLVVAGGAATEMTQIVTPAPPPTAATVPVAAAAALPPVSEVDQFVYAQEAVEPPPEEGGRWGWALLAGLGVAALILAAVFLLGGGKKVEVPNVVTADVSSAEIALSRKGFSTDTTLRPSDEPKGTVIGQDPAGGSRVEEGSTVNLVVSDGPGTETIPDLRNKGRVAARRLLKERGFTAVRETEEFSADIRKDRVIETRPAVGQELELDEEITLVVSKGKEQAEVPKVVDLTEEEAKRQLEAAGFKVSVKTQESEDKEPGTVVAQSPDAGGQADDGSTVTITVAKEPAEVDVPDVIGEDQGQATETLSAAGFTVKTTSEEVTDQEQDGKVLTQSPAAGKAKKGTAVTIKIGRFTPDLDPDPDAPEPDPTETTP